MTSITGEDIATVISILPISINEDKPLIPSNYQIKAVRDTDNEVETLVIKRGSFRVYIDESRPALIIPEPADVIAAGICRDFKVSASNVEPGIAEPGLFWSRGAFTREEVLASKDLQGELYNTRAKQTKWFKNMIAMADDDWNRYHQRRMISDLQRLACKCLHIERPWDIDLEIGKAVKMLSCKFCRAEVHPEAIICMHCRGVLDMAKFKSDFVSADTSGGF
jgi:hypothetical protein